MSLTGHNQRRRQGRAQHAAWVESLDRRSLKALLARHGARVNDRESAARLRRRARRLVAQGGRP